MENIFLFVYGRLREFYSKEKLEDVKSMITSKAETKGLLFDYNGDAVMIEDVDHTVYGNLIVASDMNLLLRHTDNFMGFNEENYEESNYVRVIREIFVEGTTESIKAWCYIYPTSRRYDLETKGKVIDSGDWVCYTNMLLGIKEKKSES